MGKFKFELNRAGVAELLKGAEMQQILSAEAGRICRNCTAGNVGVDEYKAETTVKSTRAVATVRAATRHAYYSNLKYNTLVKAMSRK